MHFHNKKNNNYDTMHDIEYSAAHPTNPMPPNYLQKADGISLQIVKKKRYETQTQNIKK